MLRFLLLSLFFLTSFLNAEEDQKAEDSEKPAVYKRDPNLRSRWQIEIAESKTYIEDENKVQHDQRAVSAYVIPITGGIDSPQLYILRRGLKEARENNIDLVILEVDTPGGALNTTLEIMEVLNKYEGKTAAFINDEAISAGSFICIVTDNIYFSPQGTMGAAEPINISGEDIGDSAKRKLESYIEAKVRVLTRQHRYRSDIQKAMMNPDFEFKIDERVVSAEGELLTLTADEAVEKFGEPPAPLLSDGIVEDTTALLKLQHGDFDHQIKKFELTWSEHLAKWMNSISPLLMGLGMMLIFLEFKTPGFGAFGILGIICFLLVFASHYVAGLAGHEPLIVFAIGVILLIVELFVLPGILISGIFGIMLIFASVIWSAMDLWPGSGFDIDPELLVAPITNLVIALFIALGGIIVLSKVIPGSWFWDRLVLSSAVPEADAYTGGGGHSVGAAASLPAVGSQGYAITNMHPSGEVEIDGVRYLAKVNSAVVEAGSIVQVIDHKAFQLIVEEVLQ